MELHIRAVRPDDAAALYELRCQPEVQKFTTAMPSERPNDFLARLGPDDHVFVAEIDGRVVGVAGLHGKTGKRLGFVEEGRKRKGAFRDGQFLDELLMARVK